MSRLTEAQIDAIGRHFDIGPVTQAPIEILGGKENQVWCVQTLRGKFAIKRVLSRARYEETEKIAIQFRRRGIPTTTAHSISKQFVYVTEGQHFLLLDWIESVKYLPDQIRVEQAESIGILLAQMHAASVSSSAFNLPVLNDQFYHFDFDIRLLTTELKAALLQKMPYAEMLKQQWRTLMSVIEESVLNDRTLFDQYLLSHRDITPNNVVWTKDNQPLLIDWELAGLIHPLVELLGAAFDWSIVKSNEIEEARFLALIKAYRKNRSELSLEKLPMAFSVLMGTWLSWLFFNLQRFINASDQVARTLGAREVQHTLFTFLYVYPQRAHWLQLLKTTWFS